RLADPPVGEIGRAVGAVCVRGVVLSRRHRFLPRRVLELAELALRSDLAPLLLDYRQEIGLLLGVAVGGEGQALAALHSEAVAPRLPARLVEELPGPPRIVR